MKKGDQAELVMKKILRKGMEYDQNTYSCTILGNDLEEECIYLILEDDMLENISLDAIYECTVLCEEKMMATGRIAERFRDAAGSVLKFKIENGFYKITIKRVDK